jgi:hypothetical protein
MANRVVSVDYLYDYRGSVGDGGDNGRGDREGWKGERVEGGPTGEGVGWAGSGGGAGEGREKGAGGAGEGG